MLVDKDVSECREHIKKVAISAAVADSIWWLRCARDLGFDVKVDKIPWWWPRKSMNAITITENQIWLTNKHFDRTLKDRCITYIHEYWHVLQYKQGKLTWLSYIFDKKKREEVENEAYQKGYIFGRHFIV